jgi:hypothetical protein
VQYIRIETAGGLEEVFIFDWLSECYIYGFVSVLSEY